jgi:hypothetical protein
MSRWGRNDEAVTANSSTTAETSNGAPIGTWSLVKAGKTTRVDGANAHFGNTSAGSRASVDADMYGNVTPGAFINNIAVGVFGVDTTEISVAAGPIATATVSFGGSGYGANAVVTITAANGTTNVTAVNAHSNSTTSAGRIDALKIAAAGTWDAIRDVSIAAPASINVVANTTGFVNNNVTLTLVANTTGFSNTDNVLLVASANAKVVVGDQLSYSVPAGNTAIAGLTANTSYYVVFVNSTALALSTTAGGANVDITDARTDDPGESHTLTGTWRKGGHILVSSANSKWTVSDRMYYEVPAGNTAIAGLTGNSYYYVTFANTTAIAVSATSGGPNVAITDARTTNPGETHTITGDTAMGGVTVGGGKNRGIAHAGWVVRREGTGGRAGRVTYEVLVAMGSLGAQTAAYGTPADTSDASDDTLLPDA